jgi:hypothetical protein
VQMVVNDVMNRSRWRWWKVEKMETRLVLDVLDKMEKEMEMVQKVIGQLKAQIRAEEKKAGADDSKCNRR